MRFQHLLLLFGAATSILSTWAEGLAGGSYGVKPEAAAQGQAIFAGQTEYLLCGSLIVNDGTIKRVLFDGGYASVPLDLPSGGTEYKDLQS